MDKLLTEQQAAELLMSTPDTLKRWRHYGQGAGVRQTWVAGALPA